MLGAILGSDLLEYPIWAIPLVHMGPILGSLWAWYDTIPMHYVHMVLPRILDEGYTVCCVHCSVGHYGIGALWGAACGLIRGPLGPSPRC